MQNISKTPQAKSDLIRVYSPKPNEVISSPLKITGEARGQYFFESSFPIELINSDKKIIAEGFAEAQGEWMTSDFVPFKAIINFEDVDTEEGFIILRKSNASGRPELDESFGIPVKF